MGILGTSGIHFLFTRACFALKSVRLCVADMSSGSHLCAQDSREERTFRVWLLSLLRNEVHIQNLTESLRDGYVLLRVLDTIAAGCVAWPSVHKPPFKPLLKQPKSIENCNQVFLS